jgi:hypothetical protein
MSVERINAAIRQCLDHCYAAENPLACWADFMNGMWADPAWNKGDVEQAHLATRRILKALLFGDSDHLAEQPPDSTEVAQGMCNPSLSGARRS